MQSRRGMTDPRPVNQLAEPPQLPAPHHPALARRSAADGHLVAIAQAVESARDPELALRSLTELRRAVDVSIRLQAARGLAAGCSFTQIAHALGISRQAAHSRFRELTPGRTSRRLAVSEQTRQLLR